MVRFILTLFVAASLLAPMQARADSLYFEFLPDFGDSLLVATSPQPVEQVFLPLNDHLNSIDVWVSNDDTAGDATFRLYEPSGTLVSQTTLLIPSIADSAGGTRFNVPLNTQIQTTANQPYVLRITSSEPTLRLYHANQRSVLAHNSQSEAAYSSGLARLSGEDQVFSFQYGLSENNENLSPVLSNVTATVVSVQQVQIYLNASEPIDLSVDYGPQGGPQHVLPYSGQYTSCPDGLQPCGVSLVIFDPGTIHEFTLTARDVWNNTVQVSGTFTSAGVSIAPSPTPTPSATPTPTPAPDTTPPVITNARAANVSNEEADIVWTTDEAANTLAVVQFGIDNITIGGGSDSTLELEHLIHVTGLAQNSTYTARITSGDASGNETTTMFQFTSALPPKPGPGTPTPSATPTPTVTVTSGGDGGAQAVWSSGGAANGYRIDIFGPNGEHLNSIYTDSTSADLGELPEGARIIVYADKGDGIFERIGTPASVRRIFDLETLLANLPLILGILGSILVIGGLTYLKLKKPALPVPAVAPKGGPEERHDFTSST